MKSETSRPGKRLLELRGVVWKNFVVIGQRLTSIYKAYVFSEMVENADGTHAETSAWPARIARGCGVAVAMLGALVLLGWVLDIDLIKSVLPDLVEMKANTALCFLLSGAVLWATASPGCQTRRWIRSIGTFLLIAIGLATVFEYLSGANLGIDELLIRDLPDTDAAYWLLPPGRMALVSAVAFIMAGCSLSLLRGRATVAAQLLACTTALTALFSLATYLWRDAETTGTDTYTSLALNTTVGFTVLAVGLLAAAPPRGPVAVLMSATRSGALVRLLLPLVIGVTLVLGTLETAGQRAGWYGVAYGRALFVLIDVTVLAGSILYVARRAFLSELIARESEDRVRELNTVLEQRVIERTQALVESNERVTTLLNSTAEGIYGLDLKGKGTFFNAASLRMLGYDRVEDLIGRDLHQLLHHSDADGTPIPAEACSIRRVYLNGIATHVVDEVHWRRDGTSLPVEYWSHPIRKDGRITGCVVSFLDITQRKKAEDELDRFFNLMPSMMVIAGFDGYVKRVNPTVLSTGGWSSIDDINAEPFVNYFHPEDRELVASRLQLLLAGSVIDTFEARSRYHVDSYRWFSWSATSFLDWQVIFANGQDVTERKRAEEALVESERFARSTLDSLSAHIAILDENGMILATNRTWREFAIANSAETEVGVGVNYLDACDSATGPYAEESAAAASGIRAVIRGEQADFALEYPCHSPLEKRWFMARATRFTGDGPVRVVMSHENITAARLANEERQKFVFLVENSIDFIGMATLSGEVLYVNPAVVELLGLDPDKRHAGLTIDDFYTEAGLRTLHNINLPALMTTGRWKGEIQFRNFQTGQPIEIEASTFLVRDPKSGEPLYTSIIGRDITASKRAEESLRLNLAAMEAADNGIAIADINGTLQWVNPAFTKLTGYAVTEAIGLNPRILKSGKQELAFYEQLWNTITSGEVWHGQLVNKRKDGSLYDEEMTITPVQDKAGQITNFVAIKQDITERKRSEEALRLNLSAMEAAANGIAISDADGTLKWINPAFTKLTGYSATEVIGHSTRVLKSGKQPPEFYQEMWKTITAGEVWHGELINKRKDGCLYDEDMTITPVRDGTGAISHFVAIKQDITERKRTEDELQLAKKSADAANQAKSEFLANMSHEIRTPMNGIIGLTGLALDTELVPEQREYLDGVMLSAESLMKLINSILDFSKIEAGKLELERIDFHLREALAIALKTFTLHARKKQLELSYEVRPEVPDLLIGDPGRLWQIVSNLVSNALKFTPHGAIAVLIELDEELNDGQRLVADAASVRVEADGISRNAPAAGSDADRNSEPGASAPRLMGLPGTPDNSVCLRFTVRDTGVGIPADRQAVLFQPFTQADNSTTRKYGGTGLGLVICQKLVELMGGRIWFESEEGHGSQFHFTARFGLLSTPLEKPTKLLPSEIEGLRVLVEDDNATNRHILTEQLMRWRMKPTVVDSGAAALATLSAAVKAEEPFRLILLDVMMPEVDGFTLLEQIHQQPEMNQATIIILSSADDQRDILRAHELGAAAYLVKPVPPAKLLDTILTALGKANQQTAMRGVVSPDKPVEPQGRPLHILVAEDNSVNQLLAKRTLEKAGHSVAVANNGEEAVAAVNRETFDVVLMDVQMPVMDGFQATARIREQEIDSGKHQQIVAMTAHALKGDRERCLEMGMDGYVSKPIRNSELFSAIAAAVKDSEQWPTEADK